jgi:integrase
VLDDRELAQVILAARKMGGPYGGIVELLALTGQRREEVAGLPWEELDLAQRIWTIPKARTKNAKAHIVYLSRQALTVLKRADRRGPLVFSLLGTKYFQHFTHAKRQLDQRSVQRVIRVQVRPAMKQCERTPVFQLHVNLPLIDHDNSRVGTTGPNV